MEEILYHTTECTVHGNTVRIHLPERTAEEQLKQHNELEKELQRFGVEMVRSGLL